MDTMGNLLFDKIYSKVDERLEVTYKIIGLPSNFEYSPLEQL